MVSESLNTWEINNFVSHGHPSLKKGEPRYLFPYLLLIRLLTCADCGFCQFFKRISSVLWPQVEPADLSTKWN